MIQRIQTVLLFLAAILLGLQFIFPYASAAQGLSGSLDDGVFGVNDRMGLQINTGLALALAIIAIFLYKNRPAQSRITTLAIFAGTVLAVSVAAQCFILIREAGSEVVNIHYQPGIALPALSVLLLWIANRFIRKDEELVKSSDRLR
jgi:hypothetical protein